MTLMLFNGDFLGMYIGQVYKVIALGTLSDKALTLTGAIGGIMNGISRPILGALFDKYGFKKVYFCMLCL